MDNLTIFVTIMASVGPTLIALITSFNQSKINKQNNELQLQLNNQNINNQLELKKFDSYYSEKNKVISSFIDCLIGCIHCPTPSNLINLEKCSSKTAMYVSGNAYSEVNKVIDILYHSKLKDEDISNFLKIRPEDFISAINLDNIKNHN